jgi:uncharacterized membrane protein YsdA (DUF1294 family)
MKKFGIFLIILIITPLFSGLYGIIHDQVTYSISVEYFTKFKFYQFGLMDMGNEAIFPNPRIQVSIIGFMATWWLGIPIGLLLGIEVLRYKEVKNVFKAYFKGIFITISIAILGGIVGYIYSHFFLVNKPLDNYINYYIPDNVIDINNYIIVGTIHNFSYVSGIIGLLVALIYSSVKRKKTNRLLIEKQQDSNTN